MSNKVKNFISVKGPSFLNTNPTDSEWSGFLNNYQDPTGLEFAKLWLLKAQLHNGVPLRKAFSFEELVKFGRFLLISKHTGSDRWVTTYCGDHIVEETGIEATGKDLSVFREGDTLDFWLETLTVLREEHCPVIEYNTLELSNKDDVYCSVFNFPLKSAPDSEVDIYIGYEIYTRESLIPANLS